VALFEKGEKLRKSEINGENERYKREGRNP
jgi:hypothetical protein